MGIFSILDRLRLRWHLKDEFRSEWLRSYFSSNFGVDVGLYSYGCFDRLRFPPGTVIGRYCSFAPGATVLNANHGIDFISLHPFLYNTGLGLVEKETIRRTRCEIEDDCWVGRNALILPSVRRIGRGAVIGAGAVVTKDVPPYSIVAGNPARVVRYRFSPEIIEAIEGSNWWSLSCEELAELVKANPHMVFRPAEYFCRRGVDDRKFSGGL